LDASVLCVERASIKYLKWVKIYYSAECNLKLAEKKERKEWTPSMSQRKENPRRMSPVPS
jgi:hypothetical protein